jgi:hypothetical protein
MVYGVTKHRALLFKYFFDCKTVSPPFLATILGPHSEPPIPNHLLQTKIVNNTSQPCTSEFTTQIPHILTRLLPVQRQTPPRRAESRYLKLARKRSVLNHISTSLDDRERHTHPHTFIPLSRISNEISTFCCCAYNTRPFAIGLRFQCRYSAFMTVVLSSSLKYTRKTTEQNEEEFYGPSSSGTNFSEILWLNGRTRVRHTIGIISGSMRQGATLVDASLPKKCQWDEPLAPLELKPSAHSDN